MVVDTYEKEDYEKSQSKLTNDDFRKLMMTNKHGGDSKKERSEKRKSEDGQKQKHSYKDKKFKYTDTVGKPDAPTAVKTDSVEAHKRKRKMHFAKVRQEEEEREKEMAAKYRDRAKERREGDNPDYHSVDLISASSGYKAVAPDAKTTEGAAERRKQMIQESKFLGGDMEHTHLVKGLDYALLQKVRSEIGGKDRDEVVEELPTITSAKLPPIKNKKVEGGKSVQGSKQPDDLEFVLGKNVKIENPLAKNICRAVFCHKMAPKNDLFSPRRMAYVIDLEDEYADTDIPTTLLRSKADCPLDETQATLTTNDIVINKLTQILSYLRQGVRGNIIKKSKKKGAEGGGAVQNAIEVSKSNYKKPVVEDSIYGDIGDYVPALVKKGSHQSKTAHDDSTSTYHLSKSYFSHPNANQDGEEGQFNVEGDKKATAEKTKKMIQNINEKYGNKSEYMAGQETAQKVVDDKDKRYMALVSNEEKATKKNKLSLASASTNTYAECYPGYVETMEAVYDSDDEVDFTKMDLGNKKGPVGRWDFDTQEEYSSYMSNKEALPKAAFQYGVKMSDGRKTRRTGPKDEKVKLDQEWQKISKIIQKRKDDKVKN